MLRVPSGPVWTADLVSVYSGPTSTCVVCVSRGGDVVFWPELSTTQHMTQTEIELATNDTVKGICPVSVSCSDVLLFPVDLLCMSLCRMVSWLRLKDISLC